MTLGTLLERIDLLKPNPFSEDMKCAWVSRVEAEIALDVLKNQAFSEYHYPQDGKTTLLAPIPHDEIYLFYLSAMIDFYGKDMAAYNNSMMLYNMAMDDFRKWKRRTAYVTPT